MQKRYSKKNLNVLKNSLNFSKKEKIIREKETK